MSVKKSDDPITETISTTLLGSAKGVRVCIDALSQGDVEIKALARLLEYKCEKLVERRATKRILRLAKGARDASQVL